MILDIHKIELLQIISEGAINTEDLCNKYLRKKPYKPYSDQEIFKIINDWGTGKDGECLLALRDGYWMGEFTIKDKFIITNKGEGVLQQLKDLEEDKALRKQIDATMTQISKDNLLLTSKMVRINWWIAFVGSIAAVYYLIEMVKFFWQKR
jgi:hypothetical protein